MSFTVYVFASHLHDCNLLRSFKSQLPQERLRNSSIDFRPPASGPFTSCAIAVEIYRPTWNVLAIFKRIILPINTNWTVHRDATREGLDALKTRQLCPLHSTWPRFILFYRTTLPPSACCYFAIFVRLRMAETFFKITSEMKIKWSEIHRRVTRFFCLKIDRCFQFLSTFRRIFFIYFFHFFHSFLFFQVLEYVWILTIIIYDFFYLNWILFPSKMIPYTYLAVLLRKVIQLNVSCAHRSSHHTRHSSIKLTNMMGLL